MSAGILKFQAMKEVTARDYLTFVSLIKRVVVANVEFALPRTSMALSWGPSGSDLPEQTTVWSFPDRGNWGTHDGRFRGNWSPFVARNLIRRYTAIGEWVLDPMMGAGTTLVECKLLGRNAIGVDINLNAVVLSIDRLRFRVPPEHGHAKTSIRTYVGDARRLEKIPTETIDLIATHPPYSTVIRYGNGLIDGDLSEFLTFEEYLRAMREVASECYRVLRKNRCCAILIGDTRKHRHFVPISYAVLKEFIDAGFVLLEDIIKIQHKTASDRGQWRGIRQSFYKIAHEHLFVFRKPANDSELQKLRLSRPTVAASEVRNPVR